MEPTTALAIGSTIFQFMGSRSAAKAAKEKLL